jgi:flagellar biosynthetic protein FlhB
MGQLLGWVSTLVLLGAGLHRTLISAVLRSTASPASVAVPASSSRLRGTSPPRLSRVSPASHIKQVFSSRSLIRLAKSLVPASVVVMLGWHLLQQVLRDTPVLGLDRLPATLGKAYGLGMKAALVMVVWAAIDYAVERRAWNHRLRMSKQHVRQEMKEQLGNPQMKGKIRQLW